MRLVMLVLATCVLLGCAPKPLYAPEVDVTTSTVGYGDTFQVRMYGAALAQYRFTGAVPDPSGAWIVRIEPNWVATFAPAEVVARSGDIVPLGPIPSVRVKFVEIQTSQLVLEAVAVHTNQAQD